MTRWQAFLIHLGLSAILYLALIYLIVFHWYPQPYFAADGGWQALRLITGVDLILGPVLTLIVFKSGKPGLRRDLALIGILQFVALFWGTGLVYEQRIAIVTFADGGFYTLTEEQMRNAGGQAPVIAAESTSTPPYAFVRLPAEKRERNNLRLKTLISGKPMHQLGDRYEPLTEINMAEVIDHGIKIEKLQTTSEMNREQIERFLAQYGGTIRDYAFLPLYCRYQDLLLAVRRADGKILDRIEIRP